MENNIYIDHPLKDYEIKYKELHKDNTNTFFNKLVEKSGIDIEGNRVTVSQIRELEKEIKKLNNSHNIFKYAKIASFIIIAMLAIWGITKRDSIFVIIFSILGITGLVIAIIVYLNPRINDLASVIEEKKTKRNELENEAWREMEPLNNSFLESDAPKLLEKTVPLLKMDKIFDNKRYDYMERKYNYSSTRDIKDHSLYHLQSGEIFGNPFILEQRHVHEMGTRTYEGTKTISWTEYYYEYVDGRYVQRSRTRTETLVAHLTKPFPEYTINNYLVFCSDAAPKLTFTRVSSDANKFSDKKITKVAEKEYKKLTKQSLKKDITLLTNPEFEVFFGATNRDNEVEFRLLFTPLAQMEIMNIIKDKEIGFGDDFLFEKYEGINIISSDHLHEFDIKSSVDKYQHYEFDVIKNNFNEYNKEYFKHVYLTFTVLLSIPLYQQYKSSEFIYRNIYKTNLTFGEREKAVNSLSSSLLAHPQSVSRNINKTEVVESGKNYDKVRVTSHGYRSEERLTYINVVGGDGYTHAVPVYWDEYLAVAKNTDVIVKYMDKISKDSFIDKDINQFFVGDSYINWSRNIMAFVPNGNYNNQDDENLEKYFN